MFCIYVFEYNNDELSKTFVSTPQQKLCNVVTDDNIDSIKKGES